MRSLRHVVVAGVLTCTLLAACSTPRTSHFYTLDSESPTATEPRSALVLALGPIDLPEYLDRPQLVTRIGGNRLEVDEFNRWGGALDEEISRALADRIGARLGTRQIYLYPSRIAPQTDYRVAIDIRAFDGELGGTVTLAAAWAIIDDRTAGTLRTNQGSYVASSDDASYAAYVAALSTALGQLADALAADLQQLPRAGRR